MSNKVAITEQLDRFITGIIDEYQCPGLAIAAAQGEELVYSKGYGVRDQVRDLPVDDQTVFGIGSVTKSFTSLAVMQLVERGKLSLVAPVAQYLPEFAIPGLDPKEITIHHLLSHTSGLPPIPALEYAIASFQPSVSEGSSKPIIKTGADILQYIKTAPIIPLGAPGQAFSYSNDGYAILAEVVERVSGLSFAEYIREYITVPLRMSRTTFEIDTIPDNITELYRRAKSGEIEASPGWNDVPPYNGCSSLKSCTHDLMSYLMMYTGDGAVGGKQLLSSDGVRQMVKGAHRYSLNSFYAYGFRAQPDYHGVTLVEHGGAWKGVSAYIGFIPEKKLSVAVLANLGGVPVVKIWLGALNLMLGLPVDQPKNDYVKRQWPEEYIARITGYYRSGEGSEMLVKSEHGELKGCYWNQCYPLEPISDDAALLTVKKAEYEIRFLFAHEAVQSWGISYGGRILRRTEQPELAKAGAR